MYELRRHIFWFAISSRIAVLVLQFFFNIICPDHNADAFKAPKANVEQHSLCDNLVNLFFGGLSRWDGEYFLHIAEHGYTYENTLAFYPLYPFLIRIICIPIRVIFFTLSIHSSALIAATLINIVCFVKSAIIFYDLSKAIFRNTGLAYKASVLYCINPASIFFSAVYSESLFAYLTFHSMLKSMESDPYVYFPICLSILTRSNGIVNIGFPIYFQLKKMYDFERKDKSLSLRSLYQFIFKIPASKVLRLICNIIIALVPFIFLQVYNYITFCLVSRNDIFFPKHIIKYGTANNLLLPGTEHVQWCQSKFPMAYSYIQKKYWNVGFLNYYQIKQIPNFLLASPILFLMLRCIYEYTIEQKDYFKARGNKSKKYLSEMFVFIVHGLFLTMFCIFIVHIQVSTRLICSASPLMYWYCALLMNSTLHNDNDVYENVENMSSKWKVFLLTQKSYALKDKLVLFYFLGYTVVGCFMFSNFLPWT